MPLEDCEVLPDNRAGVDLVPYQLGSLLRVGEVDRHVGGPGGKHAQYGDIQLGRAAGHPDADAVAGTDRRRGESVSESSCLRGKLLEGQAPLPVLEGSPAGPAGERRGEDVDQRTRRRSVRVQKVR